jgi:hypothetical protein
MGLFGPKPITMNTPRPSELLLPDVGAMRKYGAETATLMDGAQAHLEREKEELAGFASDMVRSLLPHLGLLTGAEQPSSEALGRYAFSVALGVAISMEEAELGWQKPGGSDPRAWNAVTMAAMSEGSSAADAYFVRVGYFVGRHGQPGVEAVVEAAKG